MDSSGGFEKVTLNVDIMTLIYRHLNFNDQLRLAQVNADLRFIFKEFIVKAQDYSTTNLYTYCNDDYTVAVESHSNRKLLTSAELLDFKVVCADDVLELNFEVELSARIMYKLVDMKCICEALFCGKPFINLQRLHCAVPEIHLIIPLVVKNLPYLNDLLINEAVWTNRKEVKNKTVKCLLQMKNLQRLCLNYCVKTKLKYKHFCQLICELKLEVFEGTFFVNYKKTGNVLLRPEMPLKELRILTKLNQRNFPNNYTTFLQMFENLTKVHLEVTKGVNEETWATLTKSCKNLKILTMKNTTFHNVTTFATPPTVSKLYLLKCRGLAHTNLRQILTETNITEFVSQETDYSLMEEFEDISISPLIESLDVDALDLCKFTSIYKQNENLRHIKWHWFDPFTMVSSAPHLPSCVNLQTLEIEKSKQMPNDVVLQLKHLRKLTNLVAKEHMWSDICDLLRHPPLRELNIHCCTHVNDERAPIEGFPTKVTTLNVIYDDNGYAFDFFLDLFCHNWNMQLSFLFPFDPPEEAVRLLITSKNFPTDLKEIEIRGFNINCSDLRKNFDDAMKHIRNPPLWELDLNYIILCRK